MRSVSSVNKLADTPIPKLIVTLSIPSIVSMLVTNIYNLVDTAFVGRLGTSASGAVGIVFGFMAIIQAVGFMFGQGAGSIISRSLGKNDKEKADIHATAGFFGSFLFGLLITALGFIFLDEIVMFLGSTETIFPYAKTYISYILVASPFMSSSLTLNNILRYEGKANLGMIGLMTGAILNMIGDPIFMFAMDMGISGAGLSTALSQLVSWVILLMMFILKKSSSTISFKNLKKAGGMVYLNIMTTGFPSMLRQALNSLTTVLLNSQCAVYGDAAVAGMSIVSRIIFFAFSIALGVGQGFQPVSAYNYGAGKYDRVRKGFRFTCLVSEAIVIVGCTILFIFASELVGLFRDDPDVILVGARALRLQSVAYLVLPPCMTTEMLYQSTGRRIGAAILTALRSGLLFIPALLILANLRGLAGIQEALPVSLILSAPITVVFAIYFFRKLPNNNQLPPEPETDNDETY